MNGNQKHFDLFAEFNEEERRELDGNCRQLRVNKAQPLYLSGTSIFRLLSGRIKLSRISPEGRELILDIVEPGEIFGELSLVDDEPQDTLGEALEDSRVCEIPRREFDRLLRRRPELAFRVARLIGLRRKKIEARLESLAFQNVRGRLATVLLQLSRDYGVPDSRGTLLRITLSQQDLGNFIGACRELVSLTLSEFRRRGLVDQDGRRLIVRPLKVESELQLQKRSGEAGRPPRMRLG